MLRNVVITKNGDFVRITPTLSSPFHYISSDQRYAPCENGQQYVLLWSHAVLKLHLKSLTVSEQFCCKIVFWYKTQVLCAERYHIINVLVFVQRVSKDSRQLEQALRSSTV